MAIEVLEVDEERIPKNKPPFISPVPPGKSGDILIETLSRMSRFQIFGAKRTFSPRNVTYMYRIESLKKVDNILAAGQREERKLLPLASDHPEELYRYWNYARLAKGNVLVYRMGLGLFAGMASRAKSITIIEPDPGIRKLVWPHVLGSVCRDRWLIEGDASTIGSHKGGGGYNFIFIDPVPYTGVSSPADSQEQLIAMNRLIAQAKKAAATECQIAVRGYKDLISSYQHDCQDMVEDLSNELFQEYRISERERVLDRMFSDWAMKNRRRVIERRDYKFVNAWARKTAFTVL